MTNPLALVRQLDAPITTKRSDTPPPKSRRLRRQEERDSGALLRSADRIRSAKVQKSA
jgi:hypothetical protein